MARYSPMLDDVLQTCRECGIEQPTENFYTSGDGYRRSVCKDCWRERMQGYRQSGRYSRPPEVRGRFAAARKRAAETKAFRSAERGCPPLTAVYLDGSDGFIHGRCKQPMMVGLKTVRGELELHCWQCKAYFFLPAEAFPRITALGTGRAERKRSPQVA